MKVRQKRKTLHKIKLHLGLAVVLLLCQILPFFQVRASAAAKPIRDGYYMIQSGNSSNFVLDIHNYSMSNKGNLEVCHKKPGTTAQIFYVRFYRREGMVCYYTFRALHSGKFLHKANSGKTNDVHQWSGAGANNTLWAFTSAGNGYYYIKNKTGNYLENKNGKASDGNNVITGKLSKKNSQKWKLLRLSKKPDLDVRWYLDEKHPKGIYKSGTILGTSGKITSNYPITSYIAEFQVQKTPSQGKSYYVALEKFEVKVNGRFFPFNNKYDISKDRPGKYRFRYIFKTAMGGSDSTGWYTYNIVFHLKK